MMAPRPREAVLKIAAYVGGESELPGINRVRKLSSNEGAFGPPPAAQAAFAQVAGEQHRYPDGGSAALRRAIGARFGLNPDSIVCGTGSDELIQHLCHVYGGPGTDVIVSMHGFAIVKHSASRTRSATCQSCALMLSFRTWMPPLSERVPGTTWRMVRS